MKIKILKLLTINWLSIFILNNLSAQEILKNNKFEENGEGKLAPSWIDASWGLTNKPEFSIEKINGLSVQKMAIKDIPDGKWGAFAQIIPSLERGLYKFHAKLKSDKNINVDVRIRRVGAPYTTFGSKNITLNASTWEEVNGFALLNRAQKEIFFMIQQHNPGVIYIVETSLQKVEPSELSKKEIEEIENEFGPLLPPIDEKSLLADTEQRIIKNRTAPLFIELVDNKGNAISGKNVQVNHYKHIFYFGAGFDRTLLRTNADEVDIRHKEAFLRLFNYSTVHLYWGWYEPRQGQYNYQIAIDSIRWLKEHDITPRGHPIHWNHRASMPRWTMDMNPSTEQFRQLLTKRVKQLSETVLPELHDVDVFNELANWNRWDNPFTRLAKEQGLVNMVVDCVKEFKSLNPKILTAINDYETSVSYYRLLKNLIKAGVQFDYIGMQSHMHSGNWSFEQEWAILERLSKLDKPVLFTELSVLSGPRREIDWSTERPIMNWNSDPENESKQADYLEKFYSIAYSHPNCIGVVMWDYTDRRSWLGAPVGILRKDGTKKPSFDVLDKLINEKWRTRGNFDSDANGRISIPDAFEGEYIIKVGDLKTNILHSTKSPAKLRLVISKT